MSFYPRCAIDWSHIETLAESLACGAKFPAIVICVKSRKVVDGLHRLNAHMRHFGPDAEIECIEKDYATEREMFLDAVKYNAAHGMPLSRSDRQHCVLSCSKFGCDDSDVAAALQVSASALGGLRTVAAKGRATAAIHHPQQEEIRQEWKAGKREGGIAVGEMAMSTATRNVVDAAVHWFSVTDDEMELDRAISALEESVRVYVALVEQRGAA